MSGWRPVVEVLCSLNAAPSAMFPEADGSIWKCDSQTVPVAATSARVCLDSCKS